MSKWAEIDLEMFIEIFDDFWNNADWTTNLVLEIQNIPALLARCSESRVYIGNKINLYDFKEYNENTISFLESAKSLLRDRFRIDNEMLEESDPTKISLCITTDGIPKITPISNNSFNLLTSCFGIVNEGSNDPIQIYASSLMTLWYIKTNKGKRILDYRKESFKNYNNSQKYIRMRTLDYDDWYKMIKEFAKDKSKLLWTEDDFQFNDIDTIFDDVTEKNNPLENP